MLCWYFCFRDSPIFCRSAHYRCCLFTLLVGFRTMRTTVGGTSATRWYQQAHPTLEQTRKKEAWITFIAVSLSVSGNKSIRVAFYRGELTHFALCPSGSFVIKYTSFFGIRLRARSVLREKREQSQHSLLQSDRV